MTSEEKLRAKNDSSLSSFGSLRPGSFTALMALYESNFLRLNWLIDEMDFLKGDYLSIANSDFPLYLSVTEVCRYTTSIHMTYWFDGEGSEPIADPDLDIRIYHDARLAEAMSCRHNRRHELLQGFDTVHGNELSRRWARNMMLNKWLEYCVDCKHRFRPVATSNGARILPL
ncbi:MAG: DUF1249 domain-containing protein [Gammaproteobacteria bacterium]|nr:DUF1249 domain-containing protein [Gammaproteobacteria bacterium]